ncbi:hypothetical protein V5799_022006 [Amblyomma americanum]|uniref:Uncharacterized protein n=1 Tax=Amblyomma americanum TaxID=6943 RepID=A0AAQ4FNS0_AMBAM
MVPEKFRYAYGNYLRLYNDLLAYDWSELLETEDVNTGVELLTSTVQESEYWYQTYSLCRKIVKKLTARDEADYHRLLEQNFKKEPSSFWDFVRKQRNDKLSFIPCILLAKNWKNNEKVSVCAAVPFDQHKIICPARTRPLSYRLRQECKRLRMQQSSRRKLLPWTKPSSMQRRECMCV